MFVGYVWAIVNVLYSVNAFASFLAFVAGKRLMFALALLNNIYWLVFGCYFGWYVNISQTIYFIIVNVVGWQTWHSGFKANSKWGLRNVWLLLALSTAITMYVYTITGIGQGGWLAYLNVCNCLIYGVTYTLRLYKGKGKARLAAIFYLINQTCYLVIVFSTIPILYGCAIRQIVMVYVTLLQAIWPNNNWVYNKLQLRKQKHSLANKAGKHFVW